MISCEKFCQDESCVSSDSQANCFQPTPACFVVSPEADGGAMLQFLEIRLNASEKPIVAAINIRDGFFFAYLLEISYRV